MLRRPSRSSRPANATVFMLAALSVLYIVSVMAEGLSLSSIVNGPDVRTLAQVGGSARILTLDEGEWWRLVTATLLHGGIAHILLNGLALWNLGGQLEDLTGWQEIFVVFAVTGVCGSLMSASFGPGNVVSIGASGAIFGLLGFLVTNGTHNLRQVSKQLQRNAQNLVLMLGIGLLIPGIDNWGHAGGLLSGLVLGYVYRQPSNGTRNALALVSATVLAYGAFMIVSRA
jgi:rhomboid protease GluP